VTLTTLSILIPVYNEARTVAEIIRRVSKAPAGLRKELVVVDDASTDDTRQVLEDLRPSLPEEMKLIVHDRNQGKGAAIRTGLAHVTGDIVLIQDADLEYDPRDYAVLLEPILENQADVVFGNRFHGGPHRVLYFWHFAANRALTLLTNVLTGLNVNDMEVGYKTRKGRRSPGGTAWPPSATSSATASSTDGLARRLDSNAGGPPPPGPARLDTGRAEAGADRSGAGRTRGHATPR
jgi:glycosyltransferase involved in cell wall biosynthesis